jgi:hypothetical protein
VQRRTALRARDWILTGSIKRGEALTELSFSAFWKRRLILVHCTLATARGAAAEQLLRAQNHGLLTLPCILEQTQVATKKVVVVAQNLTARRSWRLIRWTF